MKGKSPIDCIKAYLSFAAELDASDPAMGYSCRMY